MCKYFDIKNENAHTALSDARATFELYKKLMSL
jgi:DNA polymerase III epsilon subunit-like protein